jgi:putative membrane protein
VIGPATESTPPRERLHPLSPVMRGSRGAVGLVVILALAFLQHTGDGSTRVETDLVILAIAVLIAVVHWYVTWWSFDGATLTVETGLLRREVRKIPVVRIQAVDVIQPLLGKFLNLAELRIRMAGSGHDERLAYLHYDRAIAMRAALLATHHGLDASTPQPEEVPVATVPGGRLAWSVALSASTALLGVLLIGIAVLAAVSPKAGVAVGAAGLAYLVGLGLGVWRRFNSQYGFTVAAAPDGIRVRRGLLGTVAETIPTRRVQAIRQVEPLWWRPLGWSRLDVDLAGPASIDTSAGTRGVTKTLLPVGASDVVARVRAFVMAPNNVVPTRCPRRVVWKAPLSYHNLAAGHDATMAVSITGRFRRVTNWVPLEKVQSLRRVQGPVQRTLGVATVHLDVAGRGAQAVFKDRDVAEADRMLEELVVLCRNARARTERPSVPPSGDSAP